jgi:NhaP-type Na+/H+ or K+/H+ antiporter
VCVILYEGGLTLRFSEIREVGGVVRNLVTVGAILTWLMVTGLAHWLIGFDWGFSFLLGAVLVVTGPTVIGPLLRLVRPQGPVGPILKWEGIVIDPVGATLALLVFEAIHLDTGAGGAAHSLFMTVLVGTLLGLLAAGVLVFAFERHLVPDALENSVSLSAVILVFVVSNYVQEESGLLTVTVMGTALANQHRVTVHHLLEFKENLRVLLISCLFIVLAAKLEVRHLKEITRPGVIEFVLLLILVVRPVAVFFSTLRSKLSWRERLFMAFLAPRGIVAAAVASVFALRLGEGAAPHPDADRLVAITFMVIIATVATYGLAATPLAIRLGLAERSPQGALIVGAHPLARALAGALKAQGLRVLLVDVNQDNVDQALEDDLEAVHCNLLGELHAEDELNLGGIGRVLALTPNDGVNTLITQRFLEMFGRRELYQLAGKRGPAAHSRSRVLFGEGVSMAHLYKRHRQGANVTATTIEGADDYDLHQKIYGKNTLPMFLLRASGQLEVYTVGQQPSPAEGDVLISLLKPIPPTQVNRRSEILAKIAADDAAAAAGALDPDSDDTTQDPLT